VIFTSLSKLELNQNVERVASSESFLEISYILMATVLTGTGTLIDMKQIQFLYKKLH